MSALTVQLSGQEPHRNNCYIPFQALGLPTPTRLPELIPPPPTSHSPLSYQPTQSRENWTARPSPQDDIKKRGGEEEEGAEPKESAPSTSESPPPDRILEAAGDRPNRHHVTASRRVPASAPHRGDAADWKSRRPQREPAPGAGSPRNPPPTQVSRRQARPAPSPNTHSLTAPQQEQPAHPPLRCRAAPTPMSSPLPKPCRASSRCQGPRSASAPRSLLSGEDNGERVGARTARRTTETHREAPRAGPPGSQHQACQSPPQPTSGSPTIPLGDNGGWGWAPQTGDQMLGPALLQPG
ncbi:serine/arginine repetitive matrix protein 1-like [Hyaena hyaena]|uniref:serine/arginine repetitive matrix protein 1-like n=1 Tax=Hyaena hyaena TaxID=95912 RepID=UPI0019208B12|nr:serine/arginine repetitive matrix protein 1-like [Hyaena hyaena]